jgi:hypothetical protein
MDNLFEIVQDLTIAHDITKGLLAPRDKAIAEIKKHINCVDYPTDKDVDMYLETRKKLRELKIKSGEIICLDYKPTPKIINPDDKSDLVDPINPDDCDCKE